MTESADIEIMLDENTRPSTPLEDVAEVMARLIGSAPDTEAYSEGTVVVATSAGVTVRMTVTAVSAAVEDVMQPDQPEN